MSQIILNRNIKTEDYDTLNKLIDRSITTVTEDMLSGETVIDDYAFYHCMSLTSVNLPNSIISIGNSAFYECPITSITIPNGVISMGAEVFRGCTNLVSLTVKAISPPTIGHDLLTNANRSVIYVPAESVDTYKAASGWSDYAYKIQAIPV